jgi:hypothetical protein
MDEWSEIKNEWTGGERGKGVDIKRDPFLQYWMEISSQRHAQASLTPDGKQRYLLYTRLSGLWTLMDVAEEENISNAPAGIKNPNCLS